MVCVYMKQKTEKKQTNRHTDEQYWPTTTGVLIGFFFFKKKNFKWWRCLHDCNIQNQLMTIQVMTTTTTTTTTITMYYVWWWWWFNLNLKIKNQWILWNTTKTKKTTNSNNQRKHRVYKSSYLLWNYAIIIILLFSFTLENMHKNILFM